MANILTVDDSPAIRQLVTATLTADGYKVDAAEDGVLGLRCATTNQFDLVLTDVNMPNMGGFDFVRELRKLPDHQHTPVLMLTTEFKQEQKQAGRAAGASGWIVKPIDPDQLLRAVARMLAR